MMWRCPVRQALADDLERVELAAQPVEGWLRVAASRHPSLQKMAPDGVCSGIEEVTAEGKLSHTG